MARIVKHDGAERDRSYWRIAPWGLAALILLLPLVAMQFTDEVAWDETDFIVMGAMLLGACGAFELAAMRTGSFAYRAAVGVAVVAAFLLIWINLAVGIIGSENNPANRMFAGVLGIGLIGSLIARFQSRGMSRALVVTALAQILVGAVAVTARLGTTGANWPRPIIVMTVFFAVLWFLSAWLFKKAGERIQDPR